MKQFLISLTVLLFSFSCSENKKTNIRRSMDFDARSISLPTTNEGFNSGITYLSIYSEIYSNTEHTTHNLTATVSMRNPSRTDTTYIFHSDYYDTHGDLIRSYVKKPIYIAPLETVEIVIQEDDRSGGTGGNFLFTWKTRGNLEPLFEAIMISTSGQQGLSFTTQGKRIE